MSTINDGGPAFPLAEHGNCVSASEGMSLRDYFAAMALPALYSRHEVENGFAYLAEDAYDIADAMLAARKSNPSQ